MVRRISQKTRGYHYRQERELILLILEGEQNKTESIYFSHFNAVQKKYTVRVMPGNETDPIRMAHKAEKTWTDEGCDAELDDHVYCVFDTDTDSRKQDAINKAFRLEAQGHFEVVLSNPCFEVWFIEHYGYTTKQFSSSSEMIQELRKHISGYNKSKDVFNDLYGNIDKAIQNAAKLDRHHESVGNTRGMQRNPSTEVYRIVEKLI